MAAVDAQGAGENCLSSPLLAASVLSGAEEEPARASEMGRRWTVHLGDGPPEGSLRSLSPAKKLRSLGSQLFKADRSLAWWRDWAMMISAYAVFLSVAWLYGRLYRKWSFVDSIYFAVVTTHTVGYGDLTMREDSSEACVFSAVYVLAGVATLGVLAGEVIVRCVESHEDRMSFYTQQRHWQWHLFFGIVEVLSCLAVGTLGFTYLEDEHWSASLYWAVATAATVGYGDVVPETDSGKLFAVVYIPVSTALLAAGVASFARVPLARRRAELLAHLTTESFNREVFEELAHGSELKRLELSQSDDSITKNEFVLFLLLQLGKVGEEDLTACQKIFENLDRTENDKLTFEDLRLMKAGDELPELPTKTHAYFCKRIAATSRGQTSAETQPRVRHSTTR